MTGTNPMPYPPAWAAGPTDPPEQVLAEADEPWDVPPTPGATVTQTEWDRAMDAETAQEDPRLVEELATTPVIVAEATVHAAQAAREGVTP